MKKKNKFINKVKKYLYAYSRWVPPKILILFVFLVIIFIIGINCFEIDNDFWFIINTGKYILNNGIPTIEPFTIHANMDFVVQQWLTDIIFHIIYKYFNVYGMFFILVLINCIIVYLVYKLSLLISNGKVKLSFLVTIIFDCFFGVMYLRTRPQIFDTLFLILEIYLLELYVKTGKKRYLIGLPIISLLMINLHSSIWLMLFVLLLPYFAERIKYFSKEKYRIKPLIIIAIVMFICGIINPYGIKAITYLFNSYGIDTINNLVGEMQPLTITNGLAVFVYIALVGYSFYYNKSKNKTRYFFLTIGTLYLAFRHYRGILFFIICTIPALSHNFKELFKEKEKQETLYNSKPVNIIIIITFILCLGINYYNVLSNDLKQENNSEYYEIGQYLINNAEKDSIIYTSYNEGGYLEYLGYRCYLDARAEVFLKANNNKEDILDEYFDLQVREINHNDFLEKYDFDYLVTSENDILYYELEDSNYEIVFEKELKEIKYRIYKKA